MMSLFVPVCQTVPEHRVVFDEGDVVLDPVTLVDMGFTFPDPAPDPERFVWYSVSPEGERVTVDETGREIVTNLARPTLLVTIGLTAKGRAKVVAEYPEVEAFVWL